MGEHLHDYRGWRYRLTTLQQEKRWVARIEVFRPGPIQRQVPQMPTCNATAASEDEIHALAIQSAENEIDRLISVERLR